MLYKRRWGREVSDRCVDGSVFYRAVRYGEGEGGREEQLGRQWQEMEETA